MNNKKIEISYEEYQKITKDIVKNMFTMTKEDYEKGVELINYVISYENKIENLASEIMPDNKICGYYTILEYCLKKIKENDKNLENAFIK